MVSVLQVSTHDITVQTLLRPLIDRLTGEGYRVMSACSPGRWTPELLEQGYDVRALPMDRSMASRSNLKAVWRLARLMQKEKIDIVHVHTPVAAALGRVAARLARVPVIIYTAHGFYFHENMPRHSRSAYVAIEKLLGRTATHMLFTQSREDMDTAVREGICRADQAMWIGNGVDTRRFQPGPALPEAKQSFGLPPHAPVVGFIGRMVAEKGAPELIEAFSRAAVAVPDLHLMLAGDITEGDRDRTTREVIREKVQGSGLASRIVFTGFVDDVPRAMQAMDLFVLPSHREGMPRTIIEAMASGKPVVATNIRGCREEVVHGETGLLVPVKDSNALAGAIAQLATDPALAQRMGEAGRRRAEEMFDEKEVLDRQSEVYYRLVQGRAKAGAPDKTPAAAGVNYEEGREVGES